MLQIVVLFVMLDGGGGLIYLWVPMSQLAVMRYFWGSGRRICRPVVVSTVSFDLGCWSGCALVALGSEIICGLGAFSVSVILVIGLGSRRENGGPRAISDEISLRLFMFMLL